MLTSAQIRQQFLDFFREKQHTIVPSSSLLPDSPNLLFTNAGMNQFVPIFLGERTPDVDQWSGAIKGAKTRAADTQKCIRAGGKHNDLDDVGLDTYHHTFFEMLGNWSFGDYFKKDAIDWAWELIVERWGFPPDRVYATIYQPDKAAGDPAERDEEAWSHWADKFRAAGLNPSVHIVNGNKKDNFWMMGETGPCGPCSELHIDLTPLGDTRGALVNKGVPECIEIWNLVFIQFNAQPAADSTAATPASAVSRIEFVPLAQQHVDTGMGFERVASIIQGTKNFTDFANAKISNYETDIFRPIFDELEKMSGLRYGSTLPTSSTPALSPSVSPSSKAGVSDLGHAASFLDLSSTADPQKDDDSPAKGDDRPQKDADRLAKDADRGAENRRQTPEKTLAGVEKADDSPQKAADDAQKAADTIEKADDSKLAAKLSSEGAESGNSGQITCDIAFRVIADHIRTLSFAIADGISPGNTDRNYVLRRILRRAVRYGRTLGFTQPFFYKLVPVLARTMGDVFPEVRARQKHVEEVLKREEEAFNKTLDKGISIFDGIVALNEEVHRAATTAVHRFDLKDPTVEAARWDALGRVRLAADKIDREFANKVFSEDALGILEFADIWFHKSSYLPPGAWERASESQHAALTKCCESFLEAGAAVSGAAAFQLYDTYGFPLDLTELMARERGLSVDTAGFEKRMEEQRARARAAQKTTIIELSEIETEEPTTFVGYDREDATSEVCEVVSIKGNTAVIVGTSPCYAEMGGQVGDTGRLYTGGREYPITNTVKVGRTWLHYIDAAGDEPLPEPEATAHVSIDEPRRRAIERHHTVTHLLHWALHEVVSHEATQKGSFVGPDKLTFDFNSAALTPQQVRDIERLVNEKIVENNPVSWTEVPYAEVRGNPAIMQFFGDKYGETVRVAQIGGFKQQLNGFSMELCAGTHTRATGEIGLFRINGEAAIAAGVRRIEAVAGLHAYDLAAHDIHRLHTLATKLGAPLPELEKRIDALLGQQKDLERALKAAHQREAATRAKDLLAHADTVAGMHAIIAKIEGADGDTLQAIADALKAHGFPGVVILGGNAGGAVALVATVPPALTAKVQAGKIISAIAPLVGGKGGGKPESARGGGKDPTQLDAALAKAKELLG
jgi:alanyl-tRNA synthetase